MGSLALVLWISIWILESTHQLVQKRQLEFWHGFRWTDWSGWGSTALSTILCLQIHEHGMSFYFFMPYVLNPVQFFVIPWTVAHQGFLSLGFFRQEYWSGLPFPPPGDLFDPGIECMSHVSCISGGFFTCWAIREVLPYLFGSPLIFLITIF